MKHHATRTFWQRLASLSPAVQALARKNFDLLKSDPRHPSLHFKRVGAFWSVRIGLDHRALGVADEEGCTWVWIGAHDEYERMLR